MPEIVKTLSFDETEIKFTGDGKQGIFEGYASVFNNTDSDGDIILPGAFKNALANQTRKVAMFFNHKTWELPVGKWDSLAEDEKGLYVRGQLTPGHSGAADRNCAIGAGMAGVMDEIYADLDAGCRRRLAGVTIADIEDRLFAGKPLFAAEQELTDGI